MLEINESSRVVSVSGVKGVSFIEVLGSRGVKAVGVICFIKRNESHGYFIDLESS